MTKLSHVLVIEKDRRGIAGRKVTEAYHALQSKPAWDGLIRSYTPRDDGPDAVHLPPENKRLQLTVQNVVRHIAPSWGDMIDVVGTKDVGNMEAKADLVVDGVTIATELPSSHLLFLEKQLADMRTFIEQLPLLAPDRDWERDPTASDGRYRTEPVQSVKTKKVPRHAVMVPATDRHPAQTREWNEDVVDGTWSTITLSGAIEPAERDALLARVDKLLTATKQARESANTIDVVPQTHGAKVLSYVFGDMLETPQTPEP